MITWYQCKFKGLNSILIVVVIQLDVFLVLLDDNLCRCCVMVLQLSLKLTWGMLMLASLAVMRSGWSAPLPLDQEVQFPGLLGGSEDLLRLQSSGKSSRLVSPFRLLSWSINNWLSLINQHRMYVDKPLGPIIEIPRSSMILLDLPRRIDLGLLLAPSVISVMSAVFHEPAVWKDAHRHLSSTKLEHNLLHSSHKAYVL